jgi:hypothetical protein
METDDADRDEIEKESEAGKAHQGFIKCPADEIRMVQKI